MLQHNIDDASGKENTFFEFLFCCELWKRHVIYTARLNFFLEKLRGILWISCQKRQKYSRNWCKRFNCRLKEQQRRALVRKTRCSSGKLSCQIFKLQNFKIPLAKLRTSDRQNIDFQFLAPLTIWPIFSRAAKANLNDFELLTQLPWQDALIFKQCNLPPDQKSRSN